MHNIIIISVVIIKLHYLLCTATLILRRPFYNRWIFVDTELSYLNFGETIL